MPKAPIVFWMIFVLVGADIKRVQGLEGLPSRIGSVGNFIQFENSIWKSVLCVNRAKSVLRFRYKKLHRSSKGLFGPAQLLKLEAMIRYSTVFCSLSTSHDIAREPRIAFAQGLEQFFPS